MKAHIKINLPQQLIDYKPVTGGPKKGKSPVNRNAHFAKVRHSLESAINIYNERKKTVKMLLGEGNEPQKVVITFQENPEIKERMVLKSLDANGMKIMSVNTIDGITMANVSVPVGGFSKLDKILQEYATENTKKGNPKNQPFIESISNIEYGNFRALWFSQDEFPKDIYKVQDLELWLDSSDIEEDVLLNKFEQLCGHLGITVKQGTLAFKDRVVKIVCASMHELMLLQQMTEIISEIRPSKAVSVDFLDLKQAEAFQWVNGITYRKLNTLIPICILDTGINSQHPLLNAFVNQNALIVAEPQWANGDLKGHGTGIAGLALFGDLKHAIQSKELPISGVIESAKILPDTGVNEPQLYGAITTDAIYNIEAKQPSERRIYTMAVSSPNTLRGMPTSWSAAIDRLAAGSPDDPDKRLFILSAGNLPPNLISDYPEANITYSIEDPANSYNALTIGYWASEDNVITDGYDVIAELTDLGPSSTTSRIWKNNSPFKPDVVFEGGNFGYDSHLNFSANLEELSLLTLSHEFTKGEYFSSFSETSAATGMAAFFISKLWSQYPNYWPETIRALVVHSASWPKKILERHEPLRTKQNVEFLLRMSGYGFPNLAKAISSGDQSVNLIVEDSIQPYTVEGKLNKMILYSLPWPSSELEKIGGEDVKLRVTLSYFVEPNPGERGWDNKYKYGSFGLRFDFNSPGEESGEFVSRINKKFKEENQEFDAGESDANKWLLGPTLRNRGSIHSDIWSGTALELADKKFIAIYPVSGWWKELKKENRQSSIARFSLIISIETKENNLEVHNEISQLLKIDTEIENVIEI
ncbi:S8 family peptidase [Klebsiella aerogenes]|uniref:S8 family peptidase n=1 Tax=Klebsiella aerogenes TaxID=548 RepID=UPI001285FEAD|nr:S8 family peptidase [Klebsiella aerogenes]EAN9291872.1 S8 family peptidase [Salmonella enterica]EAR9989886.1 S8 family peptidase [Salmonella enterica]EKZ9890772.1 S8 family peptidase [Klebsiella aerogenes]EKZ9893631.1 S8 family peptidase [Klebsiella aerogenes]MDH1608363.1 S8 family peptidase [Klebsiella aerogenes]